MPTTSNVLGFTNRWYAGAIEHAADVELEPGLSARVVTTPYFLATKLEAFLGRGNGDYMASHDLEDIISVIDGRDMLLAEIAAAPADVRTYLSETIRRLLETPAFVDSLPGHLPGDAASQARLPLVRAKLLRIATC
jgi:predicted nucleotidyltransferase